MEQWIKKLSGAVIASLLALTLSSKAYALDGTESDQSANDEPKAVIVESDTANTNIGVSETTVPKTTAADVSAVNSSANGAGDQNNADITVSAGDQIVKNDSAATDISTATTGNSSASEAGDQNNADIIVAAAGDQIVKKDSAAEDIPAAATSNSSKNEAGTDLINGNEEDKKQTQNRNQALDGNEEVGKAAENGDDEDAAGDENEDLENIKGTVGDNQKNEIPSAEPAVLTFSTAANDAELLRDSIPEDGSGDSGEAPADDAEESGTISLDGIDFSPDENKDGYGWNNNMDNEGCLTINDFTGSSLSSENCDINIMASGLNKIGTISADGNVYVSGTGILLVDQLEFSSGNGFFLKPIDGVYSEPASVAVFLKQDEPEETPAGTVSKPKYKLINGNVPGILDEKYTIEGIDLIIPSGSSLVLTSEATGETTDDVQAGGMLNITSSASLTIENGATVKMITGNTKTVSDDAVSVETHTPLLMVNGTLNGSENIKGEGLIADNNTHLTYAVLRERLIEHLKSQFGIVLGEEFKPTFTIGSMELSESSDDSQYATATSDGDLEIGWEGSIEGVPYTGTEIINTDTLNTGTGIMKFPSSTTMDPVQIYPPAQKAANHSLILKVTELKDCYNLSAYYDGVQIFRLGNKVKVRFDYPAPTEDGQLFVVFRRADGSLKAFEAKYDKVSGQLVFDSDVLGNFVVVCIDYEGKLYTKEFYDFLETIDSVKALKAGY